MPSILVRFRRDEIEKLPDWLRDHDDVRFVAAPATGADGSATVETPGRRGDGQGRRVRLGFERDTGAHEEEATLPDRKGLSGQAESAATLAAQHVLEALIQRLNLEAPLITRSPVAFFAEQLRSSVPELGDGPDLYAFSSVVERLERLGRIEAVAREASVLERLSRPRYRGRTWPQAKCSLRRCETPCADPSTERRSATQNVRSAPHLTVAAVGDLLDSAWSAARGLNDSSSEEVRGYEVVVKAYDELDRA